MTKSICWSVGKEVFFCKREKHPCPFCLKTTVVELPPPIAAQQVDGTTHVCLPVIGGCNHGFAKT